MRHFYYLLFLFLIVACKSETTDKNLQEESFMESLTEFGIAVSQYDIVEGIVKRGQFFSNILGDMGVDYQVIHSLTQASEGIFDLRKIKIGNGYKTYYTVEEDPKPAYMVYQDTKTSFIVFGLQDSLFVKREELDINIKTKMGEATITSSLWNSCIDADMSPVIANRLSEIYAWTIDFFGLQKGDSFTVVYDEILVGDEFLDIGTIYYAKFRHNRVDYEAYRFIQDESPNYWNEKGESLRKAFLKAPLKYSRISSGFTYARRHPITRVVRPHTGIDYAAPAGTPVMSIGDGVVTQRAYAGGGGNTVKIKHNSTYSSAYLHLSRFATGLKVGKRVRQGEVIGYVGSTGQSTGPHLDFRIWQNGKPINPLKMDMPPAEPIKDANRDEFNSYMTRALEMQDSLKARGYLKRLIKNL